MGNMTESPESFALADDLGLLLSRLGTVTRLRIADSLGPVGLTMRQFAVLRALSAGEGLSQAALAGRLRIDASSLVLVLDELQKSGSVERRPSPKDRRRYAVHLTSGGRRMLLRAQEAASKASAGLFAPLSESQRSQLHDLLLLIHGSAPTVSSAPEPAPGGTAAEAR